MSRSTAILRATFLLGVAMLLPVHAARAASWATYIKMVTTNDVLALRDTVLLASGESGIVRYLRLEGRFESVTREPGGLASNSVTALAYDRSGRLWAGTRGEGVSRLSADQSRWDLVNAFDGLPSDSVTVLRADGDTIWVGTTRGLALWNGQLVAGSVPDIGTPSQFRSDFVTGIVVHADTVFVSTRDGLYQALLSDNVRTWTESDAGIANLVFTGLATNGRDVFALSAGTVYVRNPADGSWATAGVPGSVGRLRDHHGTVLAIGNAGLYRWSGTQWDIVPGAGASNGPGDLGTDACADPSGTIFQSYVQYLLEQSGGGWVWRLPPGPVDNDVQNVLWDGVRVWVATHTGGMSRFDGTTWRGFPKGCCGPGQDTSFVNPGESMMLQLDAAGRVWSAHWENAIERFDPTLNPLAMDHVYVVYGLLQSDTLCRHSDGWSSAIDSTGYLYIGGDTPSLSALEPMGIDVYDPAANRVINWKAVSTGMGVNQVRSITVDRHRVLWAGFARSGFGWVEVDSLDSDPATAGNDHLRLPRFQLITALTGIDQFGAVAHGDSLWVLTDRDLERFRNALPPTTDMLPSRYDIAGAPAPRGAVHPLDVAPDGTVWVGTVAGLRRYLPGGVSQDYTVDNSPLADNEVRAVRVEPRTGAVWIGTASGVSRFDPNYHPPAPPAIARLSLKVWPNPATLTAMGAQLRLGANAPSLSGEVVDLGGRVVRRFSGVATGGVVWDGHDGNGTVVRPGVYFVHARGGGRDAMVRVVVLR